MSPGACSFVRRQEPNIRRPPSGFNRFCALVRVPSLRFDAYVWRFVFRHRKRCSSISIFYSSLHSAGRIVYRLSWHRETLHYVLQHSRALAYGKGDQWESRCSVDLIDKPALALIDKLKSASGGNFFSRMPRQTRWPRLYLV